jgi:hypothetical protein
MHACPECRRDFRSESSYALYLARKETRAALEAELAGVDYKVPLRFQRPSRDPEPILTKQETRAARRNQYMTGNG